MTRKMSSNVMDNGSPESYIGQNLGRRQIMKQPELGRKISDLRKSKGLTQEELVDKCNISVRTLQRIEIGEVTPRSYTSRTILSALDYDLSTISEFEEADGPGGPGMFRKHILLEM